MAPAPPLIPPTQPGAGDLTPLLLLLALLSLLGLLLWRRRAAGSVAAGPAAPKGAAKAAESVEGRTRLRVVFGTQTGTAEKFAKALADEARRRYGRAAAVSAIDADGWDHQSELTDSPGLVLFLLATYGDGEPTDSAGDLCGWLKEQAALGSGRLTGLDYAVFGLGNKQYEHYNVVGKAADANLAAAGGRRAAPRGLGDDDGDIEADFAAWREALWPALEEGGVLKPSEESLTAVCPAYGVLWGEEAAAVAPAKPARKKPGAAKHDAETPFFAAASARRELHAAASSRSCVHLELAVPGLNYSVGDHVGVLPRNGAAAVAAAAALLGLSSRLDETLALVLPAAAAGSVDDAGASTAGGGSGLSPPFAPCTLREALATKADLLSRPKKASLAFLACFATDPTEVARLRHLASPEGKEEYGAWVLDSHRSLLEVMAAFPSAAPPVGAFFGGIAPRLAPRYYSISSSPKPRPGLLTITCAVVRGPTPTGRVHEGVASNWFLTLPVSDVINGGNVNNDTLTPIVMVGPGTGLAPFRGFLQERSALLSAGRALGPAILFFGCRSPKEDYIYEAELATAVHTGVLSELHVAFSRAGKDKDYVQHRIAGRAAALWALLRDKKSGGGGGHLYVCGDARAMAKDVHRSIHALAEQQGCLDRSAAEHWVKEMQITGRYLRDVW